MKTLLDPSTDVGTRFRVKQLTPTATARWGSTTAPRVMRHLVESFSVPMSDAPASPAKGGLFSHPAMRRLYLTCVPCPDRKRLVAPELEPADVAGWSDSVQAWYDACSRFVARGRSSGAFAPHPVFGPLPPEEWGRLVYFHTDHHLRQLGV
jgi:hypothetical protein